MPDKAQGPLSARLGFRLMWSLGMALLPLAILAFVQATRVETEARARAEAALLGETLLVAGPQIEAIRRARGLAAAVAYSVADVVVDPALCTSLMRRTAMNEPTLSFAGFIPGNGQATCTSTGETYDFSENPRLDGLMRDPREVLTVNAKGPISGESVLIFSHPVITDAGALIGYVALSLPHRALPPRGELQLPDPGLSPPQALITFDGEGTLLTAVGGLENAATQLPTSQPLKSYVGGGPRTFRDVTQTGERRTFAVVPMVDKSLYILSSWVAPATGAFLGGALPAWAFPVAMWLASLLVAWIAAEYQVLRHVRGLRRSIIRFASGTRTVDLPSMASAPSELRDVGDAYERMVDAILHDEAALEDTIHQKEVLLREVHHRVKNNLQLIASIMNIQMRKAVTAESKSLLKGLHDRVMSLATVHRELYQTTGLADVRADELLSRIVAQLERMATMPSRTLRIATAFDPIRLTPDQAVPLALLLTEALSNVFKHSGGSPEGVVRLQVSLTQPDPGHARLLVENPAREDEDQRTMPGDSTGLGHQLLRAFATQLSGQLSTGEADGTYRVLIDFPVSALTEAEERFVPVEA